MSKTKTDGRTISENTVIEKITNLQDEVRKNTNSYTNISEILDILDYVLVLIGEDETAENDAKENDSDSVKLKKATELVSEAQLNANDNFGLPNAKEVAKYLLEHGMMLGREGE